MRSGSCPRAASGHHPERQKNCVGSVEFLIGAETAFAQAGLAAFPKSSAVNRDYAALKAILFLRR